MYIGKARGQKVEKDYNGIFCVDRTLFLHKEIHIGKDF